MHEAVFHFTMLEVAILDRAIVYRFNRRSGTPLRSMAI